MGGEEQVVRCLCTEGSCDLCLRSLLSSGESEVIEGWEKVRERGKSVEALGVERLDDEKKILQKKD